MPTSSKRRIRGKSNDRSHQAPLWLDRASTSIEGQLPDIGDLGAPDGSRFWVKHLYTGPPAAATLRECRGRTGGLAGVSKNRETLGISTMSEHPEEAGKLLQIASLIF